MTEFPSNQQEIVSFQISAEGKNPILRVAELMGTEVDEFVSRSLVDAAHQVIAHNEAFRLSERDSLFVPDLLENPPEPTEALRQAAAEFKKGR